VDKILKEFKDFVARGNLIDLAVAFVVGVAFGALVNSFVDHLVNPLLGAIFGQPDFSTLTIDLWSDATLRYGAFLNEVISFVAVMAAVFFFIVKPYNAWKARRESGEEEAPAPPEDIALLMEIRDALKK
jgi:large conductance mechanosensitive channel